MFELERRDLCLCVSREDEGVGKCAFGLINITGEKGVCIFYMKLYMRLHMHPLYYTKVFIFLLFIYK